MAARYPSENRFRVAEGGIAWHHPSSRNFLGKIWKLPIDFVFCQSCKLTLLSLSNPPTHPPTRRGSPTQADTPANGKNANGNNAVDGEIPTVPPVPTVPTEGTLPAGVSPRSETQSRNTNDHDAESSGVSSAKSVRVVRAGDDERGPPSPPRNDKTSGYAGDSSGVSNRSRARAGGGGGEIGASSTPAGQVRQRRHRAGVRGEEGGRGDGFDDLDMSPAEEQREARAVEVREG